MHALAQRRDKSIGLLKKIQTLINTEIQFSNTEIQFNNTEIKKLNTEIQLSSTFGVCNHTLPGGPLTS